MAKILSGAGSQQKRAAYLNPCYMFNFSQAGKDLDFLPPSFAALMALPILEELKNLELLMANSLD